jgi:tRNA(fMet)-specific endonuclease VapC
MDKLFVNPIVSFHEQTLGAHNYINRASINKDTIRGYTLLQEILQGFESAPVLPFNAEVANNLTLLTRNLRDFSQVPGLATENWTL